MNDLRNAATKAREWTARRDALIRQAHAAGLSFRAIAVDAQMTHAGVAKIVKKA